MPAMSPTMTEGNIANWRVKEGDSFVTGDVLLEIETDKVQMDVEAQDDGQMAKITQVAGTKGVKVGSQIAVIADQDDDLSSIDLPAEETSQTTSLQKETKTGIDQANSEAQAGAPPSSRGIHASGLQSSQSSQTSPPSSSKPQKQTYPLYPSISQLLHEKGLSASEAEKIPASGPKGRLLKGDVLAYLGTIASFYSSEQSARIQKLGHLDLSNAKPVAQKDAAPAKAPTPQEIPRLPTAEPDTEVAVPISLTSVLSVQRRIQDTLGVTLPLSTFIARAIELANEELPQPAGVRPTADELFNDILGLNKVGQTATYRGSYMPQISALPSAPFKQPIAGSKKEPDVYDILTGKKQSNTSPNASTTPPPGIMAGSKSGDALNLFSINAVRGDERRARIFLERVKTILQIEPGRLIL